MKLRIITLLGATIFMAALIGAGCGSSSPITPAQIPTSVEYAGGAVEGDISVLTSETVQFVAKDADGNLADATEIVTTLTTPSANIAAEPGTSKGLATAKGAITGDEYGTCSLNTSNSSYIDCTGPAVLPPSDYNPRVNYAFTYGDTTLSTSAKAIEKATELGSFTGLIGVSADTINGGQYSFSQVLSASSCNGPRVTSNGKGWVFMACLNVISPGNGTIKIYWSNNDGNSWSGPNESLTGVNNTNVIKALKTTGADDGTATAYVAYNAGSNTMYIRQITGDADGNITLGPAKFISGTVYDIGVDEEGNAYVVTADGERTCQYDADEFIVNLQYRKLTSGGGFGQGYSVNGTNCSVKANPDAEPRMAVTPDGSLSYITWRDIGSGGDPSPDVTYVKVAEIDTATPSVNWEKTIAATTSATANSIWAAGQYAATDKNGNMALTWDESASSNTYTAMRTFLSTLDGSTDIFSSYLVDTMPNIDNDNPLQYSGTAMQFDFASAYHMFYRNGLGLQYTMGTISNSSLATTTLIDLSSTGAFPYGALSTDTDWSGQNFIAWQENGIESIISYVAIGTTN